MPTYDYLCNACGHRFEEFQSMSAEQLLDCPKCDSSALERLIGAGAGVIFKGSGFYGTDYRSSAYSSDQKDDSASDSKGCSPKCGTDDAPSGCQMPKKGDG